MAIDLNKELIKSASVTFKVLSVGEQSAYVEVTLADEGGAATSSQKMRLMINESYTVQNVKLTVSGA